jgi:hypothetical protein
VGADQIRSVPGSARRLPRSLSAGRQL